MSDKQESRPSALLLEKILQAGFDWKAWSGLPIADQVEQMIKWELVSEGQHPSVYRAILGQE